MKKIIALYYKYEEEFLVFLAINVIALLLIDIFNDNSNIGVKEVLTAVAAIISSFFLYMAFRENKKRNDILIYEPDYNILEKQVTEQEKKANEEVFFYNISDVMDNLNYPVANLKKITHTNFCLEIYGLFAHIENEVSYKKCLQLLNDSDKIILKEEDVPEAQKLSDALSAINTNIEFLLRYYVELMFLFNSIEKSLIIRERKISLFNRLNKLHREFSIVIEDFENKNSLGYRLREFVMIYVYWNELKKTGSGFDNNYLVPYSFIKKINERFGL